MNEPLYDLTTRIGEYTVIGMVMLVYLIVSVIAIYYVIWYNRFAKAPSLTNDRSEGAKLPTRTIGIHEHTPFVVERSMYRMTEAEGLI